MDNHFRAKDLVTMLEQNVAKTMNLRMNELANISKI